MTKIIEQKFQTAKLVLEDYFSNNNNNNSAPSKKPTAKPIPSPAPKSSDAPKQHQHQHQQPRASINDRLVRQPYMPGSGNPAPAFNDRRSSFERTNSEKRLREQKEREREEIMRRQRSQIEVKKANVDCQNEVEKTAEKGEKVRLSV